MKVVCINNTRSFDGGRGDEIHPTIGTIYTVRSHEVFQRSGESLYGYLLEEIRNPINHYIGGPREFFFQKKHFRPLTDISALQKLTKVRKLEDA